MFSLSFFSLLFAVALVANKVIIIIYYYYFLDFFLDVCTVFVTFTVYFMCFYFAAFWRNKRLTIDYNGRFTFFTCAKLDSNK